MKKSSTVFAAALAATLVLAACGDDGDGAADDSNGSTVTGCTDTYATYGEAFFKANCTLCHGVAAATTGDGVRLDSLAGIKEHKAHILERAVELKPPVMPMTGALPAADRERLKKWLNCGAP